MGKKYIIEIPDDKIQDFVGSTHFLMPYMMAGHIGHHDTGLPIEPYTEPDLGQVRKKAYEDGYKTAKVQCNIQAEKDLREVGERHYKKGLSDAWEAARKIWKYDTTTLRAIFGEGIMRMDWFMNLTASEAIEKLKAYEQERDAIQVGDEVELKCGVRPAIYMQGTKGSDEIYLLFNDGSCGPHSKSEIVRKTGRHFHEIAEVLAKMKETDNG